MRTLGLILLLSFIGSVGSLVGGLLLIANEKVARLLSPPATAFAAGALLATAFLDLLPEAIRESTPLRGLAPALCGLLLFFLMERFLRVFHRHRSHGHHTAADRPHHGMTVPLIVAGDTVHNFIDGIAIAGTVLVDPKLGVVTALAVAAHEIPQEIGDFGLLLYKGMTRGRVILVNVASACATLVAAVATWSLGRQLTAWLPLFLGVTAGFFIYIAASDLIPELQHRPRTHVGDAVMLFAGVAVATAAIYWLG